ncbi:flagellar biosynthetic protein FliR [Stenotrophobium rhamnosiphilum]|uniref:Flagellar biosynthetic protein FliR n=1 Tax=Stenotrophobium rhamnosiphilum TaxID=2029166 RepID=A0A2T5MDB9_9GAMM|nr:flagellar biosynthetic protein FliR [Stenotrophobium rhamnosiphilum]PTU30568.1 flagellar biosynthetic protein FliR [Stenotrophobium rhamnosiphilum]
MTLTDAELLSWVQHYFWTFTRIGGVLMTAPVLGSMHASRRVRLMLGLALTVVIAPLTPVVAATTLFSAAWYLMTLQQFVIGVAIGFVLMLAFEAVVMAGEIISYGMGLSFAQLADPVRGVSTPVVGNFLLILATLLFLSMNGHLILIETLANSFITMPIQEGGVDLHRLSALLEWSGVIFSGGLKIALPVMTALLLVNLAFGVLSRATPSINLQSVGFPISLFAGVMLLVYCLPGLQVAFAGLLDESWKLIAVLVAPR